MVLDKIQEITEKAEKWLTERGVFVYNFKDRAFQVPYITTSPELMFEGFKKTPFSKYNPDYQSIESNSMFAKYKNTYLELEQGFSVLITNIWWKTNIKVVPIIKEIDKEYYFLRFARSSDEFGIHIKNSIDQFVYQPSQWYFYKANTDVEASFKKDSKYFTFAFFFEKQWFESNFSVLFGDKKNIVDQIFDSNYAHVSYPENSADAILKINSIAEKIVDTQVSLLNIEEIKNEILNQVYIFFNRIISNEALATVETGSLSTIWIEDVAMYIDSQVEQNFPGIEFIAKKFRVSASKLKNDFKERYGKSLRKYYLDKQMEKASELLHQKLSVNEIAGKLKYNDPNKFSAQFKKRYGVLPSKFF